MGLFNSLMSKIFGHAAPTVASATPAVSTFGSGAGTAVAAPPAPVVDVAAILNGLAAKNPEKLDWKRSIVDLMKLVGMDSSLTARKDLHYVGDMSDSASITSGCTKKC
jgi:hypothetical protein